MVLDNIIVYQYIFKNASDTKYSLDISFQRTQGWNLLEFVAVPTIMYVLEI